MTTDNHDRAYERYQSRIIEQQEKRIHELEDRVSRLIESLEQQRHDDEKKVGTLTSKLAELELKERDRTKYPAEPEWSRKVSWRSSEFDIFMSYSRQDRQKAKILVNALKRNDVRVWWDEDKIRLAENFENYIIWALEDAMRVVVLWSHSSLHSRYVYAEARIAHELGKLLPVMIDNIALPDFCSGSHAIDLSNWTGSAEDTVLRN